MFRHRKSPLKRPPWPPTPDQALDLLYRSGELSRAEVRALTNLLWKGAWLTFNDPLAPAFQKLVLATQGSPSHHWN